jgi:type I restriction enzyme S subunit
MSWYGTTLEHWKIAQIREVFYERNQKVSDVDFAPLSVGKYGAVPQRKNVAKAASSENRKLVRIGDYVINSRSDRKGSSGLSGYNGSVSLIYHVLTPFEIIDGRFAHYLLRSDGFVEEFYRNGRGIVADLWTTRYSEMRSIEIPLPPREEQDSIVRWLDWQTSRIACYTRDKKREIECLKELRQAVIHETVTEKKWRVQTFDKVASVCANLMHPEDYLYLPQISPANIEKNTGKLHSSMTVRESGIKSDNHLFYQGQIIYSKIRPALNKVTIAPFDGLCSADMYPIKTSLNNRYLMYFMLSQAFTSQLAKSGNRVKMPKLNRKELYAMRVAVPPDDEQARIVAYLDEQCAAIDVVIAGLMQEIELLGEYEASIIFEAVTGKTDLRNADIPDFESMGDDPTR